MLPVSGARAPDTGAPGAPGGVIFNGLFSGQRVNRARHRHRGHPKRSDPFRAIGVVA